MFKILVTTWLSMAAVHTLVIEFETEEAAKIACAEINANKAHGISQRAIALQ